MSVTYPSSGGGASSGGNVWSGAADPSGGLSNITPTNMTSNTTPSPFTAFASSAFNSDDQPFRVFAQDSFGSTGFSWIGTNAGVDNIGIDLGPGTASLGRIVKQYTITCSGGNRDPKTWTYEGSLDASTWVILDTRASETSWGNPETRTYTTAVQTTAYRYYRLNITANNGDGTYIQIQGVTMLSSASGPFTSGKVGDFYFQTGTRQVYGPKSGVSTWPYFGTIGS